MSYRLKLTPRQRKVGRFIGAVRNEIQKAYAEEKAAGHTTQAELARDLGVSRSVVNRRIRGLQNLTVRSIADLAWALNREIVFEIRKPSAPAGTNRIVTTTSDLPWQTRDDRPSTETSTNLYVPANEDAA